MHAPRDHAPRPRCPVRAALPCVVALTSLVAAPSAHARGADTLTLTQYRDLIAACRKAATGGHGGGKRAERARLRARMAAVRSVTAADGTPVAVHTAPLQDALDADPDGSDAPLRLASLESVLGGAGRTLPPRGDAASQARAILAAREYAGRGEAAGDDHAPAWWKNFKRWAQRTAERTADWLQKVLRRFRPAPLPRFAAAPGIARFVQFVLYFLIGAAALVALCLLARAAADRGWLAVLRRRRPSDDPGPDDHAFDLIGEEARDPLAAARARAARGAYRDAVRLAYIASLRRLEEVGLLTLDTNRTNWEYQRALRRRARPAHDALLPATRLFDRVWYGRRPATEQEFEGVVRVYESLSALPTIGADGGPADAARPAAGEEALLP